MPKYKYSVLNTARWEADTILEWVAYYKSIGFDHIYTYCNDDDPVDLYGQLLPYVQGPDPFITFHYLPYQGQQDYMWMHFLENHKNETEWFLFADCDEFLALKGCNNIHKFMEPNEEKYDCIYFHSVWFGPQHFSERPKGSTLLQFKLREDTIYQMNYFAKTLSRSVCVDSKLINRPPDPMLNHNWPPAISARMRRANVLGEPVDEFFSDFPHSAERAMQSVDRREGIAATACFYHYLFRSRKDFIRRFERGTLGAYYYQPTWKNKYESDDFEPFIATLNAVEDTYLADYWRAYLNPAYEATIAPNPPPYPNIALGSKPTQSSTCQWSNNADPEIDAAGAISGKHTGADGFHTDEEPHPWWRTDLMEVSEIREIRLFNSLKAKSTAERAYDFDISASMDGATWDTLFRADPRAPFGGVDGHPFILRLDPGVLARFVRVQLRTTTYLHLDQVEIYGLRPSPDA